MKTIWILLLQYTDKYHRECQSDLRAFIAKNYYDCNPIYITVDNSLKCDLDAKFSENAYLISGDQSNWEFSGYDKGIHFIQNRLHWSPDDTIIIANDTFNSHYGKSYLDLFQKKSLQKLSGYFVSGYGDAYPEVVSLNGDQFQKWFRSSFLISNLKSLNKIGPFQFPFEKDRIFSTEYPTFFKNSDFLSANYQTFIKSWLFDTTKNDIFQHEWHSKKPLTPENYGFLQNKTRSILAEHYFSIRVQKEKKIYQHYVNRLNDSNPFFNRG